MGKQRFINAGMFVEMLESISNTFGTFENTKKFIWESKVLLMRGCLGTCWKASTTLETNENTKKYHGQARFIYAEMLRKMLESIPNLRNHCKYKEIVWKTRFINSGMLVEMLENIEHLQNH